MFRFKFQQFELRGRCYVPLPRMTRAQVEVVGYRLQALGFRTSGTDRLRAVRGGVTVILERRGLCWSNSDLTDILAPAVPPILGMRKEPVSLRSLCRSYFQVRRRAGRVFLRLFPRLESSFRWELLRAAGSCALTPDEHSVYSRLLSYSKLDCELLTDYPTDGSRVTLVDGRQYYSSRIDGAEAAATLRGLGLRHPGNSYLPKSSILRLSSLGISRGATVTVLNELGEWCFLSLKADPRKL